jgi:hypothetical protein
MAALDIGNPPLNYWAIPVSSFGCVNGPQPRKWVAAVNLEGVALDQIKRVFSGTVCSKVARMPNHESSRPRSWEKWSTIASAFSAIVIMFATIATVVVTIHHATIFTEQLGIMQKQLKTSLNDQRPWLIASSVKVLNKSDVGEFVQFDLEITVKNVGKSPAHDLAFDGTIVPNRKWEIAVPEFCEGQRDDSAVTKISERSFAVVPQGEVTAIRFSKKIERADFFDAPDVIGCIFYRWRAEDDPTNHHQTGFFAPLPEGGTIFSISPD